MIVTDEEIDKMTEEECRHLFLSGYAFATLTDVLGEDGYRRFIERLKAEDRPENNK